MRGFRSWKDRIWKERAKNIYLVKKFLFSMWKNQLFEIASTVWCIIFVEAFINLESHIAIMFETQTARHDKILSHSFVNLTVFLL